MVGELTWRKRLFGLWLPLVAFIVIALFPFTWMAATSLKTNAELYNPKASPLAIQNPSLVHYIDLLKETNFLTWVANTMLVAVAVTYLIPQTLLFVPMADLIGRMKLGNTLSAVMLTYPTLLVPFIAWLLMGYFKTVPKELEEQALIDGASRWRAMTRVILPLCMPGFISAGIFAFTLAQNEFLYALLFLSRSSVRTVPIGVVGELIRGDAFYWGQLMAGALLGSVPVALIYSFFVKYYVAGLTAGAVKG